MAEIVMPRLSDSMEEGTILTWMKRVGEEVAVGDELVEIETDKANMAYESDVAGTLTQVLAEEGDTLAIGSPIAVVGDPGDGAAPETSPTDTPPDASSSSAGNPPPEHPQEGITPIPAQSAGVSVGERVKASPVARRIAQDNDVDLTTLEGSGPGGRIVKADVERARVGAAVTDVPVAPSPRPATVGVDATGTETAKGVTTYQDLTRLQQVVSRRMAESKATAPHFYLQAEIDMSAAVEARSRLKKLTPEGEVVPSFNDMIVKACALALREFPLANGAYRDGRFELYSRVNVGVAVAAQDALVVPTVFDADKKGLREIATDARKLAGKVRDGSITPPELSGGTFTVSNLGMYGVSNFSAVINTPQAAILAVGAITEKPAVRDGQITTAHLLGVTLACDHRILYGAPAAEFLARIRSLLEEPLSLAL
ncbi:MAG TPA: dihydrolipoamide acetyltransferase family protein [Solirubrobacterales bacterium]|jgi:pyruvate dehydrogenase E2 component (dihydrolipoamide acetyltransferase)|nr:dihydrolipoamide acetyltransferase family protein [Solirubrobacterales bacterium]